MSNAPKIDPRQIEYLPLTELTPDPRNPKAHDDEVIDASIGRFGILDLIVQDQRTGYIVSGHGRHGVLTQMQERGESAPEGVKLDEDGSWLVPVVTGWASRTDTEAAAALIALDRTTELGGWVDDNLLELLDDLQEAEDGLAGVGFEDSDVEHLKERLKGDLGWDLDDKADEWDGESGLKSPAGSQSADGDESGLTIHVDDDDVVAAWDAWRSSFDSDSAALASLLESVGVGD